MNSEVTTMDIEKFMATTKPRGGQIKLLKRRDDIMRLVHHDYAIFQVEMWLRMVGDPVCLESITQFVNSELAGDLGRQQRQLTASR